MWETVDISVHQPYEDVQYNVSGPHVKYFRAQSSEKYKLNNVGPASQMLAQHYFTTGPMYRVIRLVPFRGIKRQCTRMAVRANTAQSPNSASMLGQHRICFDRH